MVVAELAQITVRVKQRRGQHTVLSSVAALEQSTRHLGSDIEACATVAVGNSAFINLHVRLDNCGIKVRGCVGRWWVRG